MNQSERAKDLEEKKVFLYSVTEEECVEDLKTLQNQFPLKNIGRDFYRIHGKYSDKTWNRYFGNFGEYKRAAGIEYNREQSAILRGIAKNNSLEIFRKFYNEEVLPYHEKYKKSPKDSRYPTMVCGSDFHDIHSDPFVLGVFIKTCEMIQPDIIILNGDIFDNYEFSKYDCDMRNADPGQRYRFVHKYIFEPLRAACPDAQIDFIIGNHEWRILKILAADSKNNAVRMWLSDCLGMNLSQWFGLDKYEINLVSKLDLSAYNPKDVTDELKQNYKKYFDCFIAAHIKDYGFGMSGTSGHTHRPELTSSSNIPMGNVSWNITGCIKKKNAEYVEGIAKWTNGFSIIHIDAVEKTVQQIPIVIPGNFVVIEGVRFVRSDFPQELPMVN